MRCTQDLRGSQSEPFMKLSKRQEMR